MHLDGGSAHQRLLGCVNVGRVVGRLVDEFEGGGWHVIW